MVWKSDHRQQLLPNLQWWQCWDRVFPNLIRWYGFILIESLQEASVSELHARDLDFKDNLVADHALGVA